jgi:hypothetical protein
MLRRFSGALNSYPMPTTPIEKAVRDYLSAMLVSRRWALPTSHYELRVGTKVAPNHASTSMLTHNQPKHVNLTLLQTIAGSRHQPCLRHEGGSSFDLLSFELAYSELSTTSVYWTFDSVTNSKSQLVFLANLIVSRRIYTPQLLYLKNQLTDA